MPKVALSKPPSRKSAFFNNPIKIAAGVFAITTLGFVTTLCIALIPIGAQRKMALADLDKANEEFQGATQKLAQLLANIKDAQQRVKDLGCVITEEQQFKLELNNFFTELSNSTATASDRLKIFWKLEFRPDRKEVSSTTERKYYEDYFNDANGNAIYYSEGYDEVTTIHKIYKNIVQAILGSKPSIPRLDCGLYSTKLELIPESYVTGASPSSMTGAKTTKFVYIDYDLYYGSRVQLFQSIEGQLNIIKSIVPRETSQVEATNTLVLNLYQLFAAFVMAATTTTKYPALQHTINDTIPALQSTIPGVNATLLEKAQTLMMRQADYNTADEHFHTALSIWLPMLIIPFVLGLSTCLFLRFGKERCMKNEAEDIELQQPSNRG